MKKITELLEFHTPENESVIFPVATVEGKSPGPHFVITAGIHGGDMVEKLEPFTLYHTGADAETDQKSREMAYYYGLPNLIATTSDGTWPDRGSNYANSAEHKIPAIITEYQNFVWLYTPVKGIFFRDISIGENIQKNQTVGHIEDYFGNTLTDIKAPVTGKILCLTCEDAPHRPPGSPSRPRKPYRPASWQHPSVPSLPAQPACPRRC